MAHESEHKEVTQTTWQRIVDNACGGVRRGELVVFVAKNNVGKTVLTPTKEHTNGI